MSAKFERGTILVFLLFTSCGLAQLTPPAKTGDAAVTISVYDYAHVSTAPLQRAEEQAQRVFRQAGVRTTWVNCYPTPEKFDSTTCSVVDTAHLVMKILPRAISAGDRANDGVFGYATVDEDGIGYNAYAFYDRVAKVAEERKLGQALLGEVLAHEIGHLLLGSKSHSVSGIMSPHWNGPELRNISEGSLCFLPGQSRVMRDRMHRRSSHSAPASLYIAASGTNRQQQ